MTISTVPVPVSATPVTYGRDASIARFSVERYQKMIDAGILDEDDKVELLENYVVVKMSRNPPHDSTLQQILEVLFSARPSGWGVRVQSAVALSDSRPEPDVAFVRGAAADFKTRHPGPADIGLVVEVSDTSLTLDLADKSRIYARANLPCYWVVDVPNQQVVVFTQPSGPVKEPTYAATRVFVPGDAVPLELDGIVVTTISVNSLLG